MSGLIDLDVIAGAKATHRFARLSASKARVVLNLIRDEDLGLARDRLRFCERGAAEVVSKVLESAVANATNNEQLDADELYVAECWADEGPVLKRWRPRARGRATRIFKQTCHITVIVAQLSPEELEMREARLAASGSQTAAAARAARVAASRAATDVAASEGADETNSTDETATADADDSTAVESAASDAAADTGVEEAAAATAESTGATVEKPDEAAQSGQADQDDQTDTASGSDAAGPKEQS